MKSYYIRFGGGLESLSLRDVAEPAQPSGNNVVVALRAVSLNYRERMILEGRYPLPVLPELIPVSDGAGEVIAVGPDVKRVSLGDRVALSVFARWHGGPFRMENADQFGGSLHGTLTEQMVVDAEACVRIPEHLTFAEAATLPCAGVTAWNALTGATPLQPGHTVLTMGSGAVSLFAIQFAKLFGARVVATTSSDRKAQRLRDLGADVVVNYADNAEWSNVVREHAPSGCDVAIEVGGVATLGQSMRALAPGGTVSLVGNLGGRAEAIDAAPFAGVFSLRRIAIGNRAQFEEMVRAIEVHGARPVVDRVFPFDEARAAFEYYARQTSVGKVVIEVGPSAR